MPCLLLHLMSIVTLLACTACIIQCIEDFACKTFLHGLFVPQSGILCNPTQTQCLTAFRTNFHRNLVSCTTHTASLYFQNRHYIFHCLFEHFQCFFTGLFGNDVECTVNYLLCNALLTVNHYIIDQTGYELGFVNRILQHVTFCDFTSSWHFRFPPSHYLLVCSETAASREFTGTRSSKLSPADRQKPMQRIAVSLRTSI